MNIRQTAVTMIPIAIASIASLSPVSASESILLSPNRFVTSPHSLIADTTERHTRTVTENGVTTTTRSVTTSTITPVSSDALVSVLNARRYDLDKMIGDGMVRHTISADTGVSLQSELNQVTADWIAARSTGQPMTMNQAVTIARQLDTLSGHVVTALGITPLSRLTVGDTPDNSRIVIDQFGNVIGLQSASPDIYIGTLEARRLQLENTIALGLASATLTQVQADELRAELDRVSRAQSENRGTGFTYVNALPLAMSLDYVGNQLRTVVHSYTFDPLINGNRFVVSGGAVIMLDDVMVRRAELESKISQKLASRSITLVQANSLRDQLGSSAGLESQMRSKGGLTFKDSRILYEQFDKVGTRLDGYIADGPRTTSTSY
jgi:hypothetical protein